MKDVAFWDLGRKARPPKPVHPQPGQLWSITRWALGRHKLTVLTMQVEPCDELGRRQVQCLVIESDSKVYPAGTTVTLSNGCFNPPNVWIK